MRKESMGLILVTLTLLLCVLARVSEADSPSPLGNFEGVWDTDWGEMTLTQSGASVSGNYTWDDGKITGTVKDNVLIGTWSEVPNERNPEHIGEVELVLSQDGNTFSGRWKYKSSKDWDGAWVGTLIRRLAITLEPVGKILADLRYVGEQEVELAMERQRVAERHLCDLLQRMGLDYENDTGEGG